MADGLSPAQRVLLEEACRIADRLDRLDDLIEGGRDQWLHLSGVDGEVRVVVDALLAETRQQATALRGLMAEITKGSSSARPARPAPKKGAGVADISSRIAARRGTTAG